MSSRSGNATLLFLAHFGTIFMKYFVEIKALFDDFRTIFKHFCFTLLRLSAHLFIYRISLLILRSKYCNFIKSNEDISWKNWKSWFGWSRIRNRIYSLTGGRPASVPTECYSTARPLHQKVAIYCSKRSDCVRINSVTSNWLLWICIHVWLQNESFKALQYQICAICKSY